MSGLLGVGVGQSAGGFKMAKWTLENEMGKRAEI
jgi:hypothetical protein